jgi:hypothetical protein
MDQLRIAERPQHLLHGLDGFVRRWRDAHDFPRRVCARSKRTQLSAANVSRSYHGEDKQTTYEDVNA